MLNDNLKVLVVHKFFEGSQIGISILYRSVLILSKTNLDISFESAASKLFT